MRKTLVALFGMIALCLPAAIPAAANSVYTVTIAQVGSNVVATGSGNLDLTDLTFDTRSPYSISSSIDASGGNLALGPAPGLDLGYNLADGYTGTFSGPTSFGSGGGLANSGSGIAVTNPFSDELYVAPGYVSGTQLGISTATFDGATFSSLGLTPGTYTWTWGSGADQGSFVLDIPAPTAAEPGSFLLLGIVLMAGLWIERKQIFARASRV